jgi:hypothetical protein
VAGDEQVRAPIIGPRQAVELTAAESWRLLAGTSLGRIVFTQHAMPAIRPVNHLVDDETVIIRSHLGAAIVGRATQDGAVVCYEADDIDPVCHRHRTAPHHRCGWPAGAADRSARWHRRASTRARKRRPRRSRRGDRDGTAPHNRCGRGNSRDG